MAAAERPWALALLVVLACCGCGSNDHGQADGAPLLSAATRAALTKLRYDDAGPPADPSNRVADDAAARRLGQRLFFDPSFSGRLLEGDNDGSVSTLGKQGDAGRVSCAGCHLPDAGFVDVRSPHAQVSLGAQWTLRKTPQLLDVAFAPLYNWDGRRDALWNQALGVIESNREFNSGRLFVAEQLFRQYKADYEAIFGEMPAFDDASRFPELTSETTGCVEINTMKGSMFRCRGLPGDGADYDGMAEADQHLVSVAAVNATKAMAAYVRQLRCGAGRFDDWLDGQADALTASEQRGAALFVEKAQCVSCHDGPRLTDDAFHNVGLSPDIVAVAIQDLNDRGAAAGIALALEDPTSSAGELSDGDRRQLPRSVDSKLEGAFRTPSLRCASQHPSYLHTGQFTSLADVIAFFDRGGHPNGYPGQNELSPLELSDAEKADLLAFLGTLEGPGPQASLRGPGNTP